MLIKRNEFMTSKARTVKKLGTSALAILAICTAAIAPEAFADDSPLVDRKVTVKFKLSELQAENGTHKVYAKLKSKSKAYCRADIPSLYYLGQSVAECTGDLMEQFIQNADIDTLTTYHLAQQSVTKTEKFALN